MGYLSIPKDEIALKHMLQHTFRSENRDFDFKSILPKEASKDGGRSVLTEEFKVSSCAFANTTGGYLIVGVNERKDQHGYVVEHEILGSREVHDVNAYLSQIIDDTIRKPIEYWDVTSIPITANSRAVHFIYIPASPSYKKPHMFDENLYHRLNGRSVAVRGDGSLVRKIVESDYFSPCGVERLKDFFETFRNIAGQLPAQYDRYFSNLGIYIKRNIHLDQRLSECYSVFCEVYQAYQRTCAPISSYAAEIKTSQNTLEVSSARDELEDALIRFEHLLLPILTGASNGN